MHLQVVQQLLWCFQGPRLLLYVYSAILSSKRLVLVCEKWLPQHRPSHSRPLNCKMDTSRESNVWHGDDS